MVRDDAVSENYLYLCPKHHFAKCVNMLFLCPHKKGISSGQNSWQRGYQDLKTEKKKEDGVSFFFLRVIF